MLLLQPGKAHRVLRRAGAASGVHHFFAAQQGFDHAHILAHGFCAGGAQAHHAHGGVARADDGVGAARCECVDRGDAARRFGGEPHAAHQHAAADLDGFGRQRHCRHGGEHI